MNVTALLDVPPQRSASPLDSAVGNDASDPAFANVMSRYQDNDNDSLAHAASETPAEPNGSASAGAVAKTSAAADAAATDSTSVVPTIDVDASGATLPLPTIVDGQTLPPTYGANPESALPGTLDLSKPDDGLDAPDPIAAAVMAIPAPLPASPPSNAGVAVAVPPIGDPADALGARRIPVDPPPVAATQATDVASTPDEDPASTLLPVDPARSIKKEGDAGIARTTVATTTSIPTNADTAQHSGSVVHALRAFGLGHGQSFSSNGSTNGGNGHSRDPNGSSADPLQGNGTPKLPNVHLAAALEAAAAPKDPATLHHEGSDSSIRTDTISQRTNGPAEGIRDTAASRLGDLAQQHAPRFAAELADRVLVLRSQRFDSATVSLEPRDLGRIDIQVRLQADTTHVAFTTQHAAVRDALDGQMPRLRAMLEEAGLSLGTVDVSQSGNRGAGDPGTARSYAQPQTAAAIDQDAVDSSTPWQRRVETSLIDLHA